MKHKCDIVILGAGAGGLSLAAGAAQMGAKVILLEGRSMGGDCLNYGCVPSKSLLSAAKAFRHAKDANKFGIHCDNIQLNFTEVMAHVHTVIDTIAVNDSVERFTALGVTVIEEAGYFIDEKHVQAGEHVIQAKRIVIATGSAPFIPSIKGLDTIDYLTNETIFSITQLPEHLIIVGGGPIGCELAYAFAMFGSKVTILEGFKLLPKDEVDCALIVKQGLEDLKVTIHEGIGVEEVSKTTEGIEVIARSDDNQISITGSHLLIATGRKPHVDNLQLEKAKVDYTPKGIKVDDRLRTSNKKIYAMGDVASAYQFTHVASYHAGIVLKNILFKLPAKVNYQAIPWVTYSDPELAHVGALSHEVPEAVVTEWPFDEVDRAHAESAKKGKIKILTDEKARILGVTIVGRNAGELLLPWVQAIAKKKTLRSFTDVIAPYPTFSEISKRAAGSYYTSSLFSDKVKRIVKFMMKIS